MSIKRTFTVLVLGVVLSAAHGMDRSAADSLSVAAREAYAAGDHKQALALFDSVHTAYTSAGLLYNIANCHFKLNDVPRAILYYERALKLAPGEEDIRANLTLARQQIADRVNEMPRFSLENTLSDVAGGSDIDQWARLAIWLCIITFVLFAGAWLSRRNIPRRILFGLAILAFMSTVISVSLAYMRHSVLHDTSEAIILAPRADVRSEPREGSLTLFVLHKGTKVSILQQVDEWYEVSLRNGNVGWIPKATLERI